MIIIMMMSNLEKISDYKSSDDHRNISHYL